MGTYRRATQFLEESEEVGRVVGVDGITAKAVWVPWVFPAADKVQMITSKNNIKHTYSKSTPSRLYVPTVSSTVWTNAVLFSGVATLLE
jgi:hypothetical protein